MSRPQIRANQLITTFGPGSMVDLPAKSVIIAGLDEWKYKPGEIQTVDEPRLAAKAALFLRRTNPGFKGQTIELRLPPPAIENPYQSGAVTPGVSAYVFPHWFIVQYVEVTPEKNRRRRLVMRGQLNAQGRFPVAGRNHPVVPVRFVRACSRGHVGDIQWRDFVHGCASTCQQDLWMEERGTTGDLSDVRIVCDCGAARSMSDAAEPGNLGKCNGSRPWLDDIEGACDQTNKLLLRTASNAYFPQLLSVISIPDSLKAAEAAVIELWEDFLCNIQNVGELAMARKLVATLDKRLGDLSNDQVFDLIQVIRDGKQLSSIAKPVKEVEFDALSNSKIEQSSDLPDGDFFARRLDRSAWASAPLAPAIQNVVQIHRLREVVALLAFTRFEPDAPDVTGELKLQVSPAPIVRNPKWMPVAENRGEGIFLQFDAGEIHDWAQSEAAISRSYELQASLEAWKHDHPNATAEFPGLPYIMLHSLSHLLISAISLDCGYPLSSLRERIYAPDAAGAMEDRYGILLYTASSGAEGTLGGLVHAARDIRKHFLRALEIGRLCSNDPVCSSRTIPHGGVDRISGSACHGCLYISETSCERFNQFLDRSLVVPTVDRRGCEFFKI
jgi:Domain of unknown function (DUF1998)